MKISDIVDVKIVTASCPSLNFDPYPKYRHMKGRKRLKKKKSKAYEKHLAFWLGTGVSQFLTGRYPIPYSVGAPLDTEIASVLNNQLTDYDVRPVNGQIKITFSNISEE